MPKIFRYNKSMGVKVITFGCKTNQYEGELIRENLNSEDENLVVINSCCVTQKVEKEVEKEIKKNLKNGKRIILTGCIRDKERIKEKFEKIEIIEKNLLCRNKNYIEKFEGHTRAFVKIQEGCENFCSYCIVPYVRGKERSRNIKDIIFEISCLAENGYKEIVLTGTNAGSFGKDTGENLISLINEISKIEKIKRIRLSSIEVYYLNDSFIKELKNIEKFCPHFHIPLQSGSDRILKLMNRRYTFDRYYERIEKIRESFENVTFTTDIIVGFPGETEEDFELSLKAIEKIKFLKVHIFPYSPRPGTEAEKLSDKIPEKIKKERFSIMDKLQKEISLSVKKEFLGKYLNVLFERKIEGNSYTGYSENYIPFIVESPLNLKNQILKVKGEKIVNGFLWGKVCEIQGKR